MNENIVTELKEGIIINRFIEIKIDKNELEELLKLDAFIMPHDTIYTKLTMKKGDVGMIHIGRTICKDAVIETFLRFRVVE